MPDQHRPARFRQLDVRWDLSAHGRRLLTLALAGLVIAVATGRPEFAGLAAPAVLLLATIPASRPAQVGVRASLALSRLVEGTGSAVLVDVAAPGELGADLRILAADGLRRRPPGCRALGAPAVHA